MTARTARLTVRGLGLATALVTSAMAASAWAQPTGPLSVPPPGLAATAQIPMLKDVGLDQKINAQIPLDTPFVDQDGRDVTIGQYFGKRPVVLQLAYFDCPLLCTQVINGLEGALEALPMKPGQDYDVIVLSFNPGDTPAKAAAKRDIYLKRHARPAGAEAGVHFLTGRQENIDAIAHAIGFKYAYDKAIDQYAHPALVTVLTPAGHVSRYLFGIEYAPIDVRLALVEAADGKTGTPIADAVLLFCYHYDPETGQYGFAILNFVRLAGALTVAALGTFIFVTLRRERRQDSAVKPTATGIR